MKKFLLCMSCFLLLIFAACVGSADNGIESEVEQDGKIENRNVKDTTDGTKDTEDVKRDTPNSANDTGNATNDTEDVTANSESDILEEQDDTLTFDITDYYTEDQEKNTFPDAYRSIYAQIIKELPEDINFSLICLDDDEIPELAVNGPRREIYSIFTVRDGMLSCFVDSILTKELEYYEKSGIISEFGTTRGGGDTGGYGLSFHQVSEDQIISDDSKPILTWSYNAIYGE